MCCDFYKTGKRSRNRIGYSNSGSSGIPLNFYINSIQKLSITNTGITASQNITAPAFVTSGGTSSQVVNGDGSLRSFVAGTNYLTPTGSGSGLTGIPTSVSNSDGTLTISPTTGSVVASLNLSHVNVWSAGQQYSADNTYSIGTSTMGLSTVYSRNFISDNQLTFNTVNSNSESFQIAGAEKMRLFAATGNVGINVNGTDNSTDKLQVGGSIISGIPGSVQGGLKISGVTAGTFSLLVPASITPYALTVPSAAPTANGQVLASTTGGTGSWVSTATSRPSATRSSATTLTLAYSSDYVFTGSTAATYTLPAISTTANSSDYRIFIKNAGSASITINTNGGSNTFYDTSLTNTYTLAAGSSITIIPDGTQWNR